MLLSRLLVEQHLLRILSFWVPDIFWVTNNCSSPTGQWGKGQIQHSTISPVTLGLEEPWRDSAPAGPVGWGARKAVLWYGGFAPHPTQSCSHLWRFQGKKWFLSVVAAPKVQLETICLPTSSLGARKWMVHPAVLKESSVAYYPIVGAQLQAGN